MNLVLQSDQLPLYRDDSGTIRVGNTRVTLDSVAACVSAGCTPEETVHQFPSLELADVYLVFAYYLRHRDKIEDQYLAPRRAEAEALRLEAAPSGREFRERLLARQRNQSPS